MKKIFVLSFLIIIIFTLTGCTSYKGYWCNYDESSTIVILLSPNNKKEDREKIEAKIDEFENVRSSNYYSREDYAESIGNINENDIFDAYVVFFDSNDHIGTYIEELSAMKGIESVEQGSAKNDLSIYNLKSFGKYTYTNSDEATESELETGKYKIKKGVITFTPDDKDGQTKILYTKDGQLCGDASCTKIYARSNATCTNE